jgi:hypothetical protein
VILEKRLSIRLFDILVGALLAFLVARLLKLEKDHHDLAEAWRYGLEAERAADIQTIAALRESIDQASRAAARQGANVRDLRDAF